MRLANYKRKDVVASSVTLRYHNDVRRLPFEVTEAGLHHEGTIVIKLQTLARSLFDLPKSRTITVQPVDHESIAEAFRLSAKVDKPCLFEITLEAPTPAQGQFGCGSDVLKRTFNSQCHPAPRSVADQIEKVQSLQEVLKKEPSKQAWGSSGSESDDWEVVPEAVASVEATPTPPSLQTEACSRGTVKFQLNGKEVELHNVDPRVSVVEYLRDQTNLTGTKIGCNEGGCGACTVLVGYERDASDGSGKKEVVEAPINGCLCPIASLDGRTITTVEGLGSKREGFSEVQERIAKHNGSQCGYCTPGFVVNMSGLLKDAQRTGKPLDHETVEKHFDGNLCRCTGYRPILNAFQSFVGDEGTKSLTGDIEDLASRLGGCCKSKAGDAADAGDKPAGCTGSCNTCQVLCLKDKPGQHRWYKPQTMKEFVEIKRWHLERDIVTRMVCGNTQKGVVKYYEPSPIDTANVLIDVKQLKDLSHVEVCPEKGTIKVGATVTLTHLVEVLKEARAACKTPATAGLEYMVHHIERVGNYQVRSAASWAGNLMIKRTHPHFPSDMVTVLASYGASVVVLDVKKGECTVQSVKDCFVDGKFPLCPQLHVLLSLHIPRLDVGESFVSFKVTKRHQNAHAYVNAGFRYTVDHNSGLISKASAILSGVGVMHFAPTKTEACLVGHKWDAATFHTAVKALEEEVSAKYVPEAGSKCSKAYIVSLSTSLFYKLFLHDQPSLPPSLQSAARRYERPVSKGVETFSVPKDHAPLSEAIPKVTATIQASGECMYTTDVPQPKGTVCGAYVQSTVAKARIVNVDPAPALAVPGVVAFVSAADVPPGGNDQVGAFPGDEEVFATKEAGFVGQAIGLIVAETDAIAVEAARLVKVEYDQTGMDKPIFTIPEAIEKKSFLENNKYAQHMGKLEAGSIDDGFKEATQEFSGTLMQPHQIHFYMETQSCLAIPQENDGILVWSSSQGVTDVQSKLCAVLGMPANLVQVEGPAVGGAYGGKISRCQPVAAAAAVAARKLGRAVKIHMDRNADLEWGPKRNPVLGKWKCGTDDNGVIKALKVEFWMDGGYTYDCSFGGMDMCQLWGDNAYYLPNYLSLGTVTKTNLPCNTAMRAPGCVNSVFLMECVMEQIASGLNKSPEEVRQVNYLKVGETTPYGQEIKEILLPECLKVLHEQSKYDDKVAAAAQFNKDNRWRKRGISQVPCKYGVSIAGYSAYVTLNAYGSDGSVKINTGGAELGQGLHTKVAQAAAWKLGIPLDKIIVGVNSTDKAPNTTVTAGSAGSECFVGAALIAAEQLTALLAPLKKDKPESTFPELCGAAIGAGVQLMTTGWFYEQPKEGQTFNYFSYGGCVVEVEIDVLTGETEILSTDIVYDNGTSLNPAVDIGQIQGAFMQGVGFFMTEEVVIDNETGANLTNGTWNYKPPFSMDLPQEFNVTLLKNVPNPVGIVGSKAVGEPPMLLASAIYFAIRNAVRSSLSDSNQLTTATLDETFLPPPLTPEAIQRSCKVDISQFVTE